MTQPEVKTKLTSGIIWLVYIAMYIQVNFAGSENIKMSGWRAE